jgi:thiol-disulfide isomerase/thioredoxin
MVHFWASWCGVCDMMEANVGSVSEDYPVVTVASWSERDGALRKRAEQWSAPVVVDPEGRLARAFGVSSVPTTFVLDADGRIQHTEVGYTTELGLRARLWLAGF